MKTIKDQLRAVRQEMKKANREARRTRAEAREKIERDEWRNFKQECVQLRK